MIYTHLILHLQHLFTTGSLRRHLDDTEWRSCIQWCILRASCVKRSRYIFKCNNGGYSGPFVFAKSPLCLRCDIHKVTAWGLQWLSDPGSVTRDGTHPAQSVIAGEGGRGGQPGTHPESESHLHLCSQKHHKMACTTRASSLHFTHLALHVYRRYDRFTGQFTLSLDIYVQYQPSYRMCLHVTSWQSWHYPSYTMILTDVIFPMFPLLQTKFTPY